MGIFTDKRELPIQARRKQFTGEKNWFGKLGSAVSMVPGLDLLGNEMQRAGSSGELSRQYATEGREEALANTINTASTVAKYATPGGPLKDLALGMGANVASKSAIDDTVATTEAFEATDSALVNDTIKKGGMVRAQDELEETVADMDADEILKDPLANIEDTETIDKVMSDRADDFLPSADDVLKASENKQKFFGEGGKMAEGIKKFQEGKFAKGVAQAANVASIGGDVAGIFAGKISANKRMEESRKKERTRKLPNERFSYA